MLFAFGRTPNVTAIVTRARVLMLALGILALMVKDGRRLTAESSCSRTNSYGGRVMLHDAAANVEECSYGSSGW